MYRENGSHSAETLGEAPKISANIQLAEAAVLKLEARTKL
jgi:hypothetical protein